MNLSSFIQKSAHETGFDAVGIARVEKESDGFKHFQAWLQKGYQGDMHYLAKGLEKRKDPTLVLENAKSFIVVFWDYGRLTQQNQGSAFISRYAWLQDYHEVLTEKLENFISKLKTVYPEAHFKEYVDTGAVMEKYWASLTGLGWVGKHTNLIRPQKGSYFFLACILTDVSLEPDSPISDHCGRCTACIDICPTKAIIAPYVLDARLCISYLTIEYKGVIPRHLRSLIGTHVFGCDDCQEICPWNRLACLPEGFLENVKIEELIEYLSFSSADFKKHFKNSPVLRAKRKGFLRNVCVVLGNLKHPSSIPALSMALNDEEPLIRAHAAWALGEFEEEEAKEALKKRKEKEQVDWVLEEVDFAYKPHPASP